MSGECRTRQLPHARVVVVLTRPPAVMQPLAPEHHCSVHAGPRTCSIQCACPTQRPGQRHSAAHAHHREKPAGSRRHISRHSHQCAATYGRREYDMPCWYFVGFCKVPKYA